MWMSKKPRLTLGARVVVSGREGRIVGSSDIGEDPPHMVKYEDTGGTEIVPMSRCTPLATDTQKETNR